MASEDKEEGEGQKGTNRRQETLKNDLKKPGFALPPMVGSVECQVSNAQLLIFFKARPRGRGGLADAQQVRRESSQRGTFWMNGRHSSAA